MKNFLIKLRRRLMGRRNAERLVRVAARLAGVDTMLMSYNDRGILKYEDDDVSGERFVVSRVLTSLLTRPSQVLVDVGANAGSYSKMLREYFPDARIHAFEPNPSIFKLQRERLKSEAVVSHNLALGAEVGRLKMYVPSAPDIGHTQHGSLYRDVLTDLHAHSEANTVEIDIEVQTLDAFLEFTGIDVVDFLKIDTEGHELAVLEGVTRHLKTGKIGLIQFEFNEMNVVSRVFLKDFYDLLQGYQLYRVDTHRLIPLGRYSPTNEIFQFQNILAVPDLMVEAVSRQFV